MFRFTFLGEWGRICFVTCYVITFFFYIEDIAIPQTKDENDESKALIVYLNV